MILVVVLKLQVDVVVIIGSFTVVSRPCSMFLTWLIAASFCALFALGTSRKDWILSLDLDLPGSWEHDASSSYVRSLIANDLFESIYNSHLYQQLCHPSSVTYTLTPLLENGAANGNLKRLSLNAKLLSQQS